MRFKKEIAGFELVVMIVSLFAFSHMMSATADKFNGAVKSYEETKSPLGPLFAAVFKKIAISFSKPMIPRVSAAGSFFDNSEDTGDNSNEVVGDSGTGESTGVLTETDTTYTEEIASMDISAGMGCCSKAVDGNFCMVTSSQNCRADAIFAEGALCSQTAVCQKGCCYDEAKGIYDQNVLANLCQNEWVADPNCNLPGAAKGCCVLGTQTAFETLGQCEVDTYARAIGEDAVVDWRNNMNELQCVLLAQEQKEGACVLSGRNCRFGTEGDCMSEGGQFKEGYLCTAVSLNTQCEPTEETTCVKGEQGVYFKDSCGNIANVYDASRINDPDYWETKIRLEDSCGADDNEGNANSKTCGNCNLVLGGFCSDALEDGFEPAYGDNYCKDTSCEAEDGTVYKTGESWCEYDGAIGNGDDVVGSRHWKKVCNQGEIDIEPCADYRNQICVQSNTLDIDGNEIEFRNAGCVANNWRECINLNTEEDGMEKCEDALNCMVDKVAVADKFKFDVCVPKYPGGFSLRNERYQQTASKVCGQATQTCTVVRKAKFTGGCKYVANEGCLSKKFAQEMNEWCTSLGDCGMEANIAGEMNEDNYKVKRSPKLSSSWLNQLKNLANPVPGQYAEVEDYSEYLDAAGVWAEPTNPGEGGEGSESPLNTNYAMGVIGIGYAVGVYATGSLTLGGLGSLAGELSSTFIGPAQAAAPLASFAGAAIGAGIGMMAGLYIAKSMGLSGLGATLMATGGAMVGGAVGYSMLANGFGGTFAAMGPIGWAILAAGAIIMIVGAFFMSSDCDPIKVEFECKVWQPPVGGDDCELCNADADKPCSEYRCQSLGASCELLNKGTGEEVCVDGHANDTAAPVVGPQIGVIGDTAIYDSIDENGFSITKPDGRCMDANDPFAFGITTDEPSYCKYDVVQKDFGEMDYDLGTTSYTYNHTTVFSLPDPSHGESQGLDISGDLTIYVKCSDTKGHVTPDFYTIDMCVYEGPDINGPKFRATQPAGGSMISFNSTSENISVITNELSTCRWGTQDNAYDAMTDDMTCDTSLTNPSSPMGYLCYADVPISGEDNNFYVRCKDQPWLIGVNDAARNEGRYVFNLKKPSEGIAIDWIEPSRDYEVATAKSSYDIQVRTTGGSEEHQCSYSFSGYDNMILMLNSGARGDHSQPINRLSGDQKIYIECVDTMTGDVARGVTEFEIIHDTSTPQVARIWQEGGSLRFVTTEEGECKFSTKTCRFRWVNGTEAGTGYDHSLSVVRGNTYFIKCMDGFGNVPTDCSIRARAL